jgi:tRNA 2-selenouridine synthase
MRGSPCLRLVLPAEERVRLLMEDYAFFAQDPQLFCERLEALSQLRGKAVVTRWQAQVRAGEVEPVVRELLLEHYDPGYSASTQRNFSQFAQALDITPADRSPDAMSQLARQLVSQLA